MKPLRTSCAIQRLCLRYAEWVRTLGGVVLCGRSGEYRHPDMDQTIGGPMNFAEKLTHVDIDFNRVGFLQAPLRRGSSRAATTIKRAEKG